MLALVSVIRRRPRWTAAAAIAAAAVLALTSCTGGGRKRPPPAPASSPTAGSVIILPPVVLRADLKERPTRWHLVATIPYGPGRAELGRVPVGTHTPVQYLPMSFAIGPDRSIWILDWVKKRLAHFTADGRYLGAVHGFFADRFHRHPRDIMMAGDRPVVLETSPGMRDAADLAIPSSDGGVARKTIHLRGRGIQSSTLYPSGDGVALTVNGRPFGATGDASRSPTGFGRVDLASGTVSMLPGIPLADGAFADPHDIGAPSFAIEFRHGGERSRLPIRMRVVAGPKALAGGAAAYPQSSSRHGVVFFTQVQPFGRANIRRYGDGRWLLAVFDDGSPLLWERLPDPRTDDEIVVRHLTVGPGDSIYLLQAGTGRVSISRRA